MDKQYFKLNSELRQLREEKVAISYFIVFGIDTVCINSIICIFNKLPSVGSLKERKFAPKLRTTRNFSKLFA